MTLWEKIALGFGTALSVAIVASKTATAKPVQPGLPDLSKLSAKKRAFVELLLPGLQKIEPNLVPIALGQGPLESTWGTSGLATKANNFFGVKCKESQTNCIEVVTGEAAWGKVVARFVVYSSPADSVAGWRERIEDLVGTENLNRPTTQVLLRIWFSGYATSPTYPWKVLSVMRGMGYDGARLNSSEERAAEKYRLLLEAKAGLTARREAAAKILASEGLASGAETAFAVVPRRRLQRLA